jgi:toxin YoeB
MRIVFTLTAWEDYQWFVTHDRKLLKRLNQVIEDALRSPFAGIGNRNASKGNCPDSGRAESMQNTA